MTDLLKEGSDWLEDQRTDFLSRTVTYQRDPDEVDVLATVGRTVFRVDGAYGLNQRHEMRDYLILAADLILAAVETLPKAGDKIREEQGAVAYIYEVMAPGGEPPWRYSDLYRKTLRIHTKQVGQEAI